MREGERERESTVRFRVLVIINKKMASVFFLFRFFVLSIKRQKKVRKLKLGMNLRARNEMEAPEVCVSYIILASPALSREYCVLS